MPPQRFSDWKNWLSRTSLDDLRSPGVYALAVSDHDLSETAFSWLPQIVYFGMTNSLAGLAGRLKQFDNTINGKFGHGGAERFCRDFPQAQELYTRLFVAVLPFKCNVTSNQPTDLIEMGNVTKAEFECFAHFASLFGRLPKYNDKKNSPKLAKVRTAK